MGKNGEGHAVTRLQCAQPSRLLKRSAPTARYAGEASRSVAETAAGRAQTGEANLEDAFVKMIGSEEGLAA